MNDQNKTKEQLIQELEATRRRVTELEVTCVQKEKLQKQLLTTEREQRALAEALCQTGTALTSTFKRDEVLDRILEQISRVVVHDAACIILFEGDKGRVFRWRGYTKFSASDFLMSGISNLSAIPVLQKIRDTHKALAVSTVNPDDEWIKRPGREWVKSYAAVPIISRGKMIGLLNIDSKTPNFVEQHDAKILQAFADQAAIALENSWLYDRARYEVARRVRSLKQERNFISAILDTIGALVVVLDPQGRIIRFNGAYEKATGFSAAEVKYRYFWELFLTPEETKPVKKIFSRLAAGRYPIEHSNHLKARNGELKQVMWTTTVLKNDRGKVEYIISTGLDVTEHQKTTEALYENRRQYKSLTDQLPVGVYQTNQNGRLLEANAALATLFDYGSVDELLNTPTLSVFRNLSERRRLLKQYKESGIIKNEIKVRTKGGSPIWIRNTGRVALNEAGEVDHIGGTIENITERKLAEKALRESQEQFNHVLSSVSDHIYVTEITSSGNRKALYISPHVEVLTGFPQEKFKADWRFMLTVVVHPSDRTIVGAHLARAMTGRSSQVEYRLIKADGSLIWVRDRIRAEIRKSSIINYGVMSDITERKIAEEALVAEQERMAITLRSITDGVIAIDAEQRVVLANPVGRKYLATLTNVNIGDVLTHLGANALDDILTVASGANNLFELELEESPKRIFEIAAQKTDTDKHIRGWVLIIRDVTGQRAIQESVQQQERLAAVGQLAAGIAHDFNNILTSMIGIAELASDTPELPPVAKQDMMRISELGQQAARLTRQILDFGRKSISEKRPLSLDSYIKETAKLLNRTISENIIIDLDIDPGDFICNADPTQMQQILTNLAINAQDAMPDGGTLTFNLARLTLPTNEPPPIPELSAGEWITLSISDTGTGIPPEHQAHVFEPFFTTKEIGKGTGLGLAQVYGIVKQHEGFIDVNSQLNQGTTFTLYFPASPIQQEPALALNRKQNTPTGNGEVILLVEDNPTVLSVTQLILERAGYRVLTATNGLQALDVYDQHQEEILLVLTDITMPEMGGTALCKALHSRNNNLKVVAMTGYPLKEGFEALSAEGFADWLAKPLSIDKLTRVIYQALR